MSETYEYFLIAALLFVTYVVIRLLWSAMGWAEYRKYLLDEQRWKSAPPPESFIDTAALAERLQHTREHLYEVAHEHRPDFKKPLMVEEKRKEISHLAYFDHIREPVPETADPDAHGLVLI